MQGVVVRQDLNRKFEDNRGFFIEVFKTGTWADKVQSNASYSHANVVRGFHYQLDPQAQGKIVQVLSGKILDVILDIRPGSPTFGQIYSVELTPGSGVVEIDPYLAHGFWALEPSLVLYHCTNVWNPKLERCINPMSEGLDLPWLHQDHLIISDKDKDGQQWRDYVKSINDLNNNITN